MVCLPFRGSCLRFSPIVPLLVSLCWMVCPPSRGSCLRLSPIVPLLVSCCRMVCPPFSRVLFPIVSHCLPSCFPLLDGVSAFPRVLHPLVSHCLPSCFPLLDGVSARGSFVPLSPIVPLLVSPCWMVCPPPEGLVSHCTRSCFPLLDGVSAFPRVLSPLVSQLVFLLVFVCWMVCPPSRSLVPRVSQLVSHFFPQLVFLFVSLYFSVSSVATKLVKRKK